MNHDEYLSCEQYANRAVANEEGFAKFYDEATQSHYFVMLDTDGKVLLISESYPNEGARNNGMASVLKNRGISEHYSLKKNEEGKYYLSLRAGNYREIARTCTKDTAADAWYLLYYTTRHKLKMGEVISLADNANNRVTDNYLPCRYYSEKAKPSEGTDIAAFYDEEIKAYFFYVTDESGEKVIFRSELYPNATVRDNGIASVQKNRGLRERYKVIQDEENKRYYVILRAGNHQEIARSCGFEHEADALLLLPALSPEKIEGETEVREINPVLAAGAVVSGASLLPETEEKAEVVATEIETPTTISETITTETESPEINPILVAGAVVSGASVLPETEEKAEIVAAEIEKVEVQPVLESPSAPLVEEKKDKEDDYLVCDEYKGYTINDKVNNVALFKHENGQFYFVVYNKDGSVRLRSEGFRTGRERDIELSGVLKNLNDESMYTVIEKAGHRIRILKDKTGREVGRSCLEKIEKEVAAAIVPSVVEEKAAEVNPLLAAGAIGAVVGGGMLLDGETESNEITPPVVEPEKVVAPEVNAVPIVEPEPIKMETTAPKMVAAETPELGVVAPVEAGSETGGFKWWWLAPLLLLIPLFFLWKGCNSAETVTPPVDTTTTNTTGDAGAVTTNSATNTATTTVVAADTTKHQSDTTKKVAPPKTVEPATTAAATNAHLHSIFFDFDKADLRAESKSELDKLVSLLSTHKDYACELKAFTDAKGNDAYNQALSKRRADNALQYLIEKGIPKSRIKTSTFGENKPIAKNNLVNGEDTEEGRQLNRRVELVVFDAKGKRLEMVDKIVVPQKLK